MTARRAEVVGMYLALASFCLSLFALLLVVARYLP